MNESTMLSLLVKIENLVNKNRFVEAIRLTEREIENLKCITEQKCKRYKINKGYCRICTNTNCNLNTNKI